MTDTELLYSRLKPDMQALVGPLMLFSESCLKKRGNFLPHAAALLETGEIKLIAAAPDSGRDITNSIEILPVLHDGLRVEANAHHVVAFGVAENVTISHSEQQPTRAIKVLCEHKDGLTIAFYLPFTKKLFRSYSFGTIFSTPANSEINAWPNDAP